MKPGAKKRWRFLIMALAAICLVLLLLLLLSELVFYAADWRLSRVPLPNPQVTFVIACIGDSHTEGIGAPAGFDYPSQLQALLELAMRKPQCQVPNLGMAGYNSSMAVDRALAFLQKSPRPPDVLLFLAGMNNAWNLRRGIFMPDEIRRQGPHAWVEYLLHYSHVYRFGLVTVNRLKTIGEKSNQQAQELFSPAEPAERDFLASWLRHDLRRLMEKIGPGPTRLVLLTYYERIEWLDDVYRQFAAEHSLLLIDLHGFSYADYPTRVPSTLVGADFHPNQAGYARYAELIHRALNENRLLPNNENGQDLRDINR